MPESVAVGDLAALHLAAAALLETVEEKHRSLEPSLSCASVDEAILVLGPQFDSGVLLDGTSDASLTQVYILGRAPHAANKTFLHL